MLMPSTVGHLKEMLKDIPDDTPLRGKLQGEPNYDWTIHLLPEYESNEYKETLIISMDL